MKPETPPLPGQPKKRFNSHMEHAFVEFVRGRIHKRCSSYPGYVYHVRQAELQYEEQARLEIAVCLAEEFPEAWHTPQVTKDWPKATCQLNAERTSGRLTVSWSPETDALHGGSPVDAIDFEVKPAPPNRGSHIKGALRAIFGKPVVDREVDIAPVGTPTGKPIPKPTPKTQKPESLQVAVKPKPGGKR